MEKLPSMEIGQEDSATTDVHEDTNAVHEDHDISRHEALPDAGPPSKEEEEAVAACDTSTTTTDDDTTAAAFAVDEEIGQGEATTDVDLELNQELDQGLDRDLALAWELEELGQKVRGHEDVTADDHKLVCRQESCRGSRMLRWVWDPGGI